MTVGIPLLDHRVAPRCTSANSMLLVEVRGDTARSHRVVPVELESSAALAEIIRRYRVRILVCGGITLGCREVVEREGARVIDNVAGSITEVLEALRSGKLRSGFGLEPDSPEASRPPTTTGSPEAPESESNLLDCLACSDRRCERGLPCPFLRARHEVAPPAPATRRLLLAAAVAGDREQHGMCRLAELLRLCLDLGMRRVGLAFCVDLRDSAEIIAELMRGVVEVVPVCCTVRAPETVRSAQRAEPRLRCNPQLQAQVLNDAGVELNVTVGLCLGADCVFTSASHAPVTTLVVKDSSLAHNPIAAVFSTQYLRQCRAVGSSEPTPGATPRKPLQS